MKCSGVNPGCLSCHLCCFMSTALRVGGVAALALVPVAVVLTVWLLRQG